MKVHKMKSIILAGGFGTRLRSVVSDVPKPMASIAGKPFLEHQIKFLKNKGLEDIVLAVHYKSDVIKSYFGDGTQMGVRLSYSDERSPMGTGGAIKLAEKYMDGPFFVFNGDSYFETDLEKFSKFHDSKSGAVGSIVLERSKNSIDRGVVSMNKDNVTNFYEKGGEDRDLTNVGIALFNPSIFDYISSGKKISLEKEVFPEIGRRGKLFGQVHDGYFIDIGIPETYSQFKMDFLEKLKSRENISVRGAMKKMNYNNVDILFITDEKGKLSGVLTEHSIQRYLINGGQLDVGVSDVMITRPRKTIRVGQEDRIYNLLKSGINHLPVLDDNDKIVDVRFRSEEVEVEKFPTIRGKSPLRISFAGGGTDIPSFFEKYGGAVISTTIDKYCNVTASKRADSKLIVDLNSAEKEMVFDTSSLRYDGNFDLIKAVYNVVDPGFGVDIRISNDVPPRRGLGSSASLASLLTKILGELSERNYNDEDLARIAYQTEVKELGIRGGKQDQYAAIFGGFNWIEFGNGDKKIIHPLRLRNDVEGELKSHLTLCYTGMSHSSKEQHEEQKTNFKENGADVSKRLYELKNSAVIIKENLLSVNPNYARIGEILNDSWRNKRALSKNVSNKAIDTLYDLGLGNGAYGGKLLGSGGGGYILFCHPPANNNKIERALRNAGGDILNFDFESRGIRTWKCE